MKQFYVFPAIFEYAEDGINIWFPDVEGAYTCAHTDEEALRNAQDVLELVLFDMEQGLKPIPHPTALTEISLASRQHVVPIRVNMALARMEIENRAVKKTLSIPQWLNAMAEDAGVNFSQVLQSALKEVLGVAENHAKRKHA